MTYMAIDLDKFNLTEEQAIEAITNYEKLLDDYCKVVHEVSEWTLSEAYDSSIVIEAFYKARREHWGFELSVELSDYCESHDKEYRTLKDFIEYVGETQNIDEKRLENMLTCLEQE